MDTISRARRSELMSRIRSKNTRPEMAVRSALHKLGYRFRLHSKHLPGRPDIVLPRHKKVVLVHGCFWHGHSCQLGSKPKSNRSYWSPKLRGNRARDKRNLASLIELGWAPLELWECEIRKDRRISEKLQAFMRSYGPTPFPWTVEVLGSGYTV